MEKKNYLDRNKEIERIIKKNRELVEALKNLNSKLCPENSLPEKDSGNKHISHEHDASNIVNNE